LSVALKNLFLNSIHTFLYKELIYFFIWLKLSY